MAFGLLIGINLFNYIDRQILAANLSNIERDFTGRGQSVSGTELGLLASAFMVAYMVLSPLFGWFAHRMSRWYLIGIGVILWSLASGASGLAGSIGILLLTRCAVGVGEAAYAPIAPAVISDMYPVEKRGQVMSWFYAAIPVGSALGYTLGGWLGWPNSFFWVVPPGLALGLCCFFLRDPQRGQSESGPSAAKPMIRQVTIRDYRRLLKNSSYVLDTLGMAGMTFALGGIGHWMPYYMSVTRQAGTEAEVNTIFGPIVVVAGLAATLLGGLAGDWLRPRFSGSYFLVSGIAMFVGFPIFLAVLFAPLPLVAVWILIFCACFCLFFNTGPTNTILANVTHPHLREPAFALNILVIHGLGDAISPTVIGWIADVTGEPGKKNMTAGFLAVSTMILLGGLLWVLGARYLAADTANALRQLDDEPQG
jgi:MFS family permease